MIRFAAPTDIWKLRRQPRHAYVLGSDQVLAQPHMPRRFAMHCMLRGNNRDHATVVLSQNGTRGIAQVQARQGRPEQDILYLAAYGDQRNGPSAADTWFHVLEAVCDYAITQRVQRVFAALPDDTSLREVFAQLGFQSYARNLIGMLTRRDLLATQAPLLMRPQLRRDAWHIHHLYSHTVPTAVQFAEMRTPPTWMLPLRTPFQPLRQQAWVYGDDVATMAYLHLLSGPSGHLFHVMLHPSALTHMPGILAFGMQRIRDDRPVYLAVRDAQQELFTIATQHGFQPVDERVLVVKSTVVSQRRVVPFPAVQRTPDLIVSTAVPQFSVSREYSYVQSIRNCA